MLFGTMTTGVFAAENGASKNTSADKFTPKVTYQVTVTDAERAKIHAAVDNLSGYVGDMVVGDKSYDPNTLIGGLGHRLQLQLHLLRFKKCWQCAQPVPVHRSQH